MDYIDLKILQKANSEQILNTYFELIEFKYKVEEKIKFLKESEIDKFLILIKGIEYYNYSIKEEIEKLYNNFLKYFEMFFVDYRVKEYFNKALKEKNYKRKTEYNIYNESFDIITQNLIAFLNYIEEIENNKFNLLENRLKKDYKDVFNNINHLVIFEKVENKIKLLKIYLEENLKIKYVTDVMEKNDILNCIQPYKEFLINAIKKRYPEILI